MIEQQYAKLIIGCGYLGRRVANRWRDEGHSVYVVTRSSVRAEQLATSGFLPIVADVTAADSLKNLPVAETVLFAVGFDRRAGLPIHDVYVDGLRNVLSAIAPAVKKFFYISSTGVYGQTTGELIDEHSHCDPQREGGQACLDAEQVLRASLFAERSFILRLAGIYGPGRIPHQALIKGGEPVPVAANAWLNLIHVDDAAQTVVELDRLVLPPMTLNVSDGQPVRRADFYRTLAELLAAAPPNFSAPPADSTKAERARSDKRIDNRALLGQLRFSFNYPSYREGLSASIER